jgi:hypothetical protein
MRLSYHITVVLLCGILVYTNNQLSTSDKAISYFLNKGRFGDNIKSCLVALWLAYKHNLRFIFKPFRHSELLQIHQRCEHYSNAIVTQFKRYVVFEAGDELQFDKPACLYFTTFHVNPGIDWLDNNFLIYTRNFIAPLEGWHYLSLPENMHTIALHIRRGGQYDDAYARTQKPLLFPSLDYYIQALQILLERLAGPCYVHLFTDDENPYALVNAIKKELNPSYQSRITLQCNILENRTHNGVVQDFFDMMQFKYFIRPRSNLSKFAHYLGNATIVLEPYEGFSQNSWGIITILKAITKDAVTQLFTTELIPLH